MGFDPKNYLIKGDFYHGFREDYEFHVNEDTDSEVSVELRGDVSAADDNGVQYDMNVDKAE